MKAMPSQSALARTFELLFIQAEAIPPISSRPGTQLM
jgi:hypothetical protein